MQEQNKNITHYNTTDIQNYLQGKLSSQEMHAIEKAALDDPFLADAIEGQQNNIQNFDSDAIELRKRLQERAQEKNKAVIIPFKLWQRVAAIAIILIGSTYLVFNFFIKDAKTKMNVVAKNKEAIQTDSAIAPNNKASASIKSDSAIWKKDVVANEKRKSTSYFKKEKSRNLAEEHRKRNRTEGLSVDSSVYADVPNNSVIKNEEKDKIFQDTLKQIAVVAAPKMAQNQLQGRVAGLNVRRHPDTSSLSEVVVTGLGVSRKKIIADSNDDQTSDDQDEEKEKFFDALPTIGWPAFNEYINQNKKIATADSAIKGKEIISFVVDANNQLSSFKIKKSLSKAHDAVSVRLIKQGPSWKLLKGKKEKITLTIEF